MHFTDGKPFVATEADCQAAWSGGKNGKYFRCALCGYKFCAGDTVRWQYTNDTPGAGGNPFVCQWCDGPKEKITQEIIRRRREFAADKNWWFLRHAEDHE